MFTIEFWNSELAEFDRLLQQHQGDAEQVERLSNGIMFLAYRVMEQNPLVDQDIISGAVVRLLRVEALMGQDWFKSKIGGFASHAMPR